MEVETAPNKHWDQIHINYIKNEKMGYFTWFVVYDENAKRGIYHTLQEHGISSQDYSILVYDKKSTTWRRYLSSFVQILSRVYGK